MKATALRAEPTERQFAAMVEKYLNLRGWAYYHTWNSRHSAPGFPDYVCVRGRWAPVYVELKTNRGKLSVAQSEWIERLKQAGQEVYVWRPRDWDQLCEVLK